MTVASLSRSPYNSFWKTWFLRYLNVCSIYSLGSLPRDATPASTSCSASCLSSSCYRFFFSLCFTFCLAFYSAFVRRRVSGMVLPSFSTTFGSSVDRTTAASFEGFSPSGAPSATFYLLSCHCYFFSRLLFLLSLPRLSLFGLLPSWLMMIERRWRSLRSSVLN